MEAVVVAIDMPAEERDEDWCWASLARFASAAAKCSVCWVTVVIRRE